MQFSTNYVTAVRDRYGNIITMFPNVAKNGY
jgi:hypothetical protein